MAAKKSVKKAVAKAPAKKASAPAGKKRSQDSGQGGKGITGYSDIDANIKKVLDSQGGSVKPGTRAWDQVSFEMRRAKSRDASSASRMKGASGGAAASRGRGSGSSAMSRTFGRLGGGLRGLGK